MASRKWVHFIHLHSVHFYIPNQLGLHGYIYHCSNYIRWIEAVGLVWITSNKIVGAHNDHSEHTWAYMQCISSAIYLQLTTLHFTLFWNSALRPVSRPVPSASSLYTTHTNFKLRTWAGSSGTVLASHSLGRFQIRRRRPSPLSWSQLQSSFMFTQIISFWYLWYHWDHRCHGSDGVRGGGGGGGSVGGGGVDIHPCLESTGVHLDIH